VCSEGRMSAFRSPGQVARAPLSSIRLEGHDSVPPPRRPGEPWEPPSLTSRWRLDAVTRTLRTAADRVAGRASPIVARKKLSRLASLAPRTPAVRRRDTRLGGLPARWFYPRKPANGLRKTLFLHLHGGGFSLCSVKHTHDMFI